MANKVVATIKPELTQTVDMQLIGRFVRFQRTALHITLEDAASLCGLSKQAYNNVEKGTENIRVDTLFKALNALGIKLKIEDSGAHDEWL